MAEQYGKQVTANLSTRTNKYFCSASDLKEILAGNVDLVSLEVVEYQIKANKSNAETGVKAGDWVLKQKISISAFESKDAETKRLAEEKAEAVPADVA